LGESAPVRGRRRPDRVSTLGRHASGDDHRAARDRAGAHRRRSREERFVSRRRGEAHGPARLSDGASWRRPHLALHERARLRRAGDRLVLAAGARLRFEAGKRIPGSPASGIAWADPPERSSLPSVLGALGATVTLVGGALAFVGSRRALAAPTIYIGSGLLLVLVLASVSLGVFGAYAAPGLSIGAPTLAAVFDL